MFPLKVRMHYAASYFTLKNELLCFRSFVPTCIATQCHSSQTYNT